MSQAYEPRIPVLPTLMTAGNILCGFVAILQIFDGRHLAMNHHYHYAIVFILLACLFDALDGRVARMGGTESPFGRELDSLADIVSFGVAPALLVHDIVLKEIDTPKGLGWLISCIYLVCGAMRLARFNCLAAMDVKCSMKGFRGCPIPAAAGVISSLTLLIIWLDSTDHEIGNWKYALAGLMVLLSYLMVSNLEYPSFKAVNWRTKRSFHWVLVSIFVIAFTVMNWHWMPAVLFVSYLMYGLVRPWVSRKWRQEIEIEAETVEIDPEVETLALNGTDGVEDTRQQPPPSAGGDSTVQI
ncbi:CDP-diacylglycerol--serine O-phosphatidyltransferase [Prosthecobacter sp.]|uniref:CDP-diacylglycerol--serine O-phosphatidyltransferase n=1 Tax=Prosthecobacter sp. TaxID=1965333 RepID=UPI00378465FB